MEMTPTDIEAARQHLSANCPVMKEIIANAGPYDPRKPREPFEALVRAIVGQQLSVKAASTIYGRLLELVNHEVRASVLWPIDQETYRSVGISRQKYGYLMDLCRHFEEEGDKLNHLPELPDEEVVQLLTQIKGVGEWTAQMFLMFTLGRPDVFAPADVGLQNAMKLHYGLPDDARSKDYISKAQDWAPYRTVACWYLWQSLDNAPK